jgi:hypothetical protein
VRLPLVPIGEKTTAAIAAALRAIRESPLHTVIGGGLA